MSAEVTVMKDKKAMYDTAMYLLAMADEALDTTRLKQAIKDIEQLIYTRENLPF